MKASPSKGAKAGVGAGKKRSRNEAGGSAEGSTPSTSPPRPNLNKEWKKSKTKTEDLLALVNSGFLRKKEMDMWRAAAGDPYPMEKNPDEVPMFARFVERGLALPVSDFFKGLLKYYGIEYLNLNPNGIFHVFVFVHFCEAFVGIKPHWILFRKFFCLKPPPSANDPRVVGGADIQMCEDTANSTCHTNSSTQTKTGRRSGFMSRTTTRNCRSPAGSSRSIGCGGTRSQRCRRVFNYPSYCRRSRL
jgi:hypothetical protein